MEAILLIGLVLFVVYILFSAEVHDIIQDTYDFVIRLFSKKSRKSVPLLSAEPLSLEEIKELEKKDFDRRLRIALDSKNIVDAEFEEAEEIRKSTNDYLDRYSKPRQG